MLKLSLRPLTLRTSCYARCFHSAEHPDEPIYNPDSPQYKILNRALLDYVPTFGFQHKAILESSRTFGYSDAIQSLFMNGTFDLIKFFLVKERLNMGNYVISDEFKTLPNELEKTKYLVKKRLLANGPYVDHLTQLQTYLVLPPNIKESSEELHKLSDDIKFYSGDKSNDFAWYTKRLTLSSAYVNLELFMANDKSPGFKNTLQLADSKISSINDLGSLYNNTEEFLFYVLNSGINVLKSQASRG